MDESNPVMKIFNNLDSIPTINNLVLTIGSFDGVHRGHQKLISTIHQKARAINGESGLMTFHPHPRMVIQPAKKDSIQLLTTIEERIRLLEKTGLDNLFIVPFSVDFANMPAKDYIKNILVGKFSPRHLVIGYDHKFGKNRDGDIHLLRQFQEKYSYSIEEISKQRTENITFSSTNIRNLLLEGNIEQANDLLGYTYEIKGIITHGDKRGRQLGFPTANIQVINKEKLIPGKGVYAVQTEVDGNFYNGMLNIGTRPTFDGVNKTIENHIFAFQKNIYGFKVRLRFYGKIRSETKFNNQDELKEQLSKDKAQAKRLLNQFT